MTVSFRDISCDRKLSPVELVPYGQRGLRPTPVARPPYCSSTYVSISATCPSTCSFKEVGCYVREGFTGSMSRRLDERARGLTGDAVVMIESEHIKAAFGRGPIPQDGARGGRDLRLHVGGDVSSARATKWLAAAAVDWQRRGGGRVWTYTHRWREVPVAAWGPISALASVESVSDAKQAMRLGYAAAITVRAFPSERAFALSTLSVIPCPAETRATTCVKCRLCFDAPALRERSKVIGFAVHGRAAASVAHRLLVVR